MIYTLIIFGLLIGSVAVAEPIDRVKLWTDAEVDAREKKWGEEVVKERGALSQHEGLTQWRKDILNSDQLPTNERIELLVRALDKISRFNIYQVSERIEIYNMAQDKMTSIPNHANYFTDKIEESWKAKAESVRAIEAKPEWQALLKEIKNSAEPGRYLFGMQSRLWGDYEEICSKNLGILGHIPSTESVKALGHYLWKRDETGIQYNSPNTESPAAESLTELIANGPMQTWMANYEDVARWQKWFDEVKAGKRTFRFVGSEVDYTLDGPADANTLKRIKDKNSSTPHAIKAGSPQDRESRKTPAPKNPPVPENDGEKKGISWIIAATIMILILSIIRWVRRKPAAVI